MPKAQPNWLLGQETALAELSMAAQSPSALGHIFMSASPSLDALAMFKAAIRALPQENRLEGLWDWCYAENFHDSRRPLCLKLKAGSGPQFCEQVAQLVANLAEQQDTEALFTSIINDQPQETRLEAYLAELASRVATGEPFTNPVLISLMVHHKDSQRPPVVVNRQLSDAGLFGEITFQTIQGSVSTDQHLLRPGDLHQANGGYLLVSADELLDDLALWQRLKEALFSQEIAWSQYRGQISGTPLFMPEAMPLDVKLVLWGDRSCYAELMAVERELEPLFPYFVEWLPFVPLQDAQPLLAHLQWQAQEARLLPLELDGATALLRHGSRLVEDNQRLALAHHRYLELLRRANSFALSQSHSSLNGDCIEHAIRQRQLAGALPRDLSREAMSKGQILIDTQGERIGQINGLTVLELAGTEFGEPSRITATVHYGDGDVIDIERKAELAGNIHAKGVMILSAFLAQRFAQDGPLHLSASLVFEQSYHEVDGDSASAAELLCLLSALAEQPLRQDLAVTGAIDQFGNIQAIGGINAKVEGFFEVCAARGLTGTQGVVMPRVNADQLNLSEEVIEAVADGRFHIHCVDHIEQAIELLMGRPAGELDEHGRYPRDSIYGLIHGRLDSLQQLEEPIGSLTKRLFSWLGHR
ncbi:Lon protease family protein [Gallaecimonas sp. GXIMD4217]|uniref:Lon protease family protein n=1 Tax=Gallaecimonas sp. GXIMD4217 TaxID=3131927 RepID=UPI00311ABE4D